MSVCLSTRGVPSVVVRTSVILGAVMPTPRWAIGGGRTWLVAQTGSWPSANDARCQADPPFVAALGSLHA
jgi:hypothetical protein